MIQMTTQFWERERKVDELDRKKKKKKNMKENKNTNSHIKQMTNEWKHKQYDDKWTELNIDKKKERD